MGGTRQPKLRDVLPLSQDVTSTSASPLLSQHALSLLNGLPASASDPLLEDPSTFPLHQKNVGIMNRPALYGLENATPESRDNMMKADRFLTDRAMYDRDLRPRTANGCTATRVPDHFIKQLVDSGNLEYIDRKDVKGWVNFFTVVEPYKRRHRPIRNTVDINNTWDKSSLIGIQFPSKQDICNLVLDGSHFAAFDFAAYYDQFAYENGISDYLCFRKKNAYLKSTRLAMGQRQGCDIAQTTTLFLLDFPGRRCKTVYAYIDNVIFVGSPDDVKHDAAEFIRRCGIANVTLNEAAFIREHGLDACIQQTGEWCGVSLDFVNKTAKLIEKTLVKTRISWSNRANWTHRQFAAHVGLLFWSWGILDIPVCNFYSLLKFISEMSRKLQQDESLWDSPVSIYPSALPALQAWTDLCLANTPNPVRRPAERTWFVCTDASKWGWGYRAFNYKTGEIRSHGQAWSRQQFGRFNSLGKDSMLHSVYAEPLAIHFSLVHLLVKDPDVRLKFISAADDPAVLREKIVDLHLGTDSISQFESGLRQAVAVATDNSSARHTITRGFASRSFESSATLFLPTSSISTSASSLDGSIPPTNPPEASTITR